MSLIWFETWCQLHTIWLYVFTILRCRVSSCKLEPKCDIYPCHIGRKCLQGFNCSLRVPIDRSNPALLEDAEKCARSLKDLEPRWSGAKRSREIIEKLLVRRRSEIAGDSPTCRGNGGRHSPENARRANKRPFADVEVASSFLVDVASGAWNPSTTGSETTHYDGCMDPMLFASWTG